MITSTAVELALLSLKEYGADITKEKENYLVVNNGIWGLIETGGVMVLDSDEIIELAEKYTDFIC